VHIVKTKKGLDIPLAGAPDLQIDSGKSVRTVAVLGRDFIGLKPQMTVQPGDNVRLGDPLFVDKRDPDVPYVAPGSGTISAVNRGARRALLSVVIDLDENEEGEPSHPELANANIESLADGEIRAALFASGLWAAFRTRPYSKVPQSDSSPRSIFVTAIDTNPLAANPAVVVVGQEEFFEAGLHVVSKLSQGPVFLCTASDWVGPTGDAGKVQHAGFSGPHPAGLVGTHIHHLDPVGAERTAWHIGYQDVIAIGILFRDGRISTERTIALGGPGIEKPRLVATRLGASVDELVAGELLQDGTASGVPRTISGSVLSGRTASGAEAFLGRYHVQISAIPDYGNRRLFGWLGPIDRVYTFSGFLKRRQGHRPKLFSTARHGRPTAMMPVDAFEQIIPMDVVPAPLLRALLIMDTDQAQALGCLELDPEDLALCSFVCPGKNDYGAALRVNLEHIEREG
jgi:Na+-transporting NADH:ubiquinone oxidoreductase subunit A